MSEPTPEKPVQEATLRELDLPAIKPYWRNPRNNRAAVEKLMQSIERYCYNPLIAVDKKNVIVAGHTRYGEP
jgi:ParB-like chromosome segregation protein Spo0J